MPISGRLFAVSTIAFLAIGVFFLAAIVGTTLWLGERAQIYFDAVIQARDARTAAVEWRNAIQVAESSQRGFLLTDNLIYLAPYDTAKATAERRQAETERIFANYPEAAAALERLQGVMAAKVVEMDQTIGLKRARSHEEALALVSENEGKALMDQANVFFGGLIGFADTRLNAAVAEERANATWLRWVSLVGGAIIIASAVAVAVMVVRYLRELATARRQLNELNSGLERRVTERTGELERAKDRAETLLREVNHRIGNSLAMVSSLISMQSRALTDKAAKEALGEAQARIQAVGLVHRRLYTSSDVSTVELADYLGGLLDHLKASSEFGDRTPHVVSQFEPVSVAPDKAVNLGVVLSEWITNAFKYAYPDGAGEVRVFLKAAPGGGLELAVEDDGVGRDPQAAPRGTGMGTRIVKAMATSLGAEIAYSDRAPGTSARLTMQPAT